ncbi:MAG: DUF427 domain-containing protein, partial [Spirochaetota bacterium]
GALEPVERRTACEYKGIASYFDVVAGGERAPAAAWTYAEPRKGYESLRDTVCFYASRMEACYVGNERVRSQEGDFYGGWITSRVVGPFKGGAGSAGW